MMQAPLSFTLLPLAVVVGLFKRRGSGGSAADMPGKRARANSLTSVSTPTHTAGAAGDAKLFERVPDAVLVEVLACLPPRELAACARTARAVARCVRAPEHD